MLIAMAGFKGAGKDTAAQLLIKEYGFMRIAFADALKEAAVILDPWIPVHSHGYTLLPLSELVEDAGWDWAKREVPEVRRVLKVLGTDVGRMLLGDDVWIIQLIRRFPDIIDKNSQSRYVITDCRFKNEAMFVHDCFGDIIWIERPGVVSDGHASETDEVKSLSDYTLRNDDVVEELNEDIRFLMHLKGIDPIDF